MDLTHLSPLFFKELNLSGSFFFTENSFSDQCRLSAGTPQLAELCGMATVGLFDFETALLKTDSENIGFVLIERNGDCGDCLIFSPAASSAEIKDEFSDLLDTLLSFATPTHTVVISAGDLREDITEYYSKDALALFEEQNSKIPAYDSVYSVRRVEKAREAFLKMIAETGASISGESSVLEICCGNGMSTLALYAENLHPVCLDVNTEDICTGLFHGVLNPAKTMIMDATKLSDTFDENSFDIVVGFMIGTVYEFNKQVWFAIVDEAAAILKKGGFLFLTLRTEAETVMIADYLKSIGFPGKMMDNRDEETGYDQWIYVGKKQ
ncbi:hypothetical protein MsAg5_04100 [Methanosarcinaceae archaeon Ag5]|uniref:Methyltransferase domain-containing protein n=1 Tax=Methanolapillus africanus TaxID=3028297 RepID=A0AAE4MH80_9EURY|nr:hypothetical protein [Methanosarcinaceae archaeon Ag5]